MISYGGAERMTDFAEPGFEEKTLALKRDFENRAFITDFSQSIQHLASFVSTFGRLLTWFIIKGRPTSALARSDVAVLKEEILTRMQRSRRPSALNCMTLSQNLLPATNYQLWTASLPGDIQWVIHRQFAEAGADNRTATAG